MYCPPLYFKLCIYIYLLTHLLVYLTTQTFPPPKTRESDSSTPFPLYCCPRNYFGWGNWRIAITTAIEIPKLKEGTHPMNIFSAIGIACKQAPVGDLNRIAYLAKYNSRLRLARFPSVCRIKILIPIGSVVHSCWPRQDKTTPKNQPGSAPRRRAYHPIQLHLHLHPINHLSLCHSPNTT